MLSLTRFISAVGSALLGLIAVGCQAPGTPGSTIPAPMGESARPAAYYTPPAGSATSAASNAALESRPTSSINLSPPAGTSVPSKLDSARKFTPRDTDQVTLRTPQDQQPIRIPEGAKFSTSTAPLAGGMPVNDGTLATHWGKSAGASNSAKFGEATAQNAGISVAGLRGTTPSSTNSRTPNAGNTNWQSRGNTLR